MQPARSIASRCCRFLYRIGGRMHFQIIIRLRLKSSSAIKPRPTLQILHQPRLNSYVCERRKMLKKHLASVSGGVSTETPAQLPSVFHRSQINHRDTEVTEP